MTVSSSHSVSPKMRFFRGCSCLLLFILLSCLAGGGEATSGKGYPAPSNCRILECPSYDVIYTSKAFEIRRYAKAIWFTGPPLSTRTYREGADRGFNFLFAYINGANAQGARVDMTTPALVDITPSTKANGNSTFLVRFYAPKKYQNGLPLPSAPLVDSERWPGPTYAAVKRFGGFANDDNIPPQVAALTKSLRGTRWAAALAGGRRTPSTYSVGSYNGPFEFNRDNEVFFLF